jgi:hypothetical protein
MRLFISYARVDRHYCAQIVEMLDVHEVWYDHRLHAGQQWWDEIGRRLEWCEGLVFLISPDSIDSKYCCKELEIARALGKHIFPILIRAQAPIPDDLQYIQYADLSSGITPEAVKLILNSIHVTERQRSQPPVISGQRISLVLEHPSGPDEADSLVTEAIEAFDCEQYDRAVFLLKQARSSGFKSKYIDLDAILNEAEDALEWQAVRREAEREYLPIALLVKYERTRKLGCQAFRAFHKTFPDYDPDNLAAICPLVNAPLLEWSAVPAGSARVRRSGAVMTCHVEAFDIGKYPITNAQFDEFADAPDGYTNRGWWDYSEAAAMWRKQHSRPMPSRSTGYTHPRVNVCWYEAFAFCRWLSDRDGSTIVLPSEAQWQRAAQGDDNRLYPWGNTFDETRCNTRESRIGRTVPVTYYTSGASSYGVLDMAGNAWEWCANGVDEVSNSSLTRSGSRVIKGGSYIGTEKRAQCRFYYSLNPECRYDSIGFRVARLKG